MASQNGTASPTIRLPQNMDAERGVLGAMLLDFQIIPEVMENVRPDDFYLPAHEVIYRTIIEMYDRGQPADLMLLLDELSRHGKLDEAGGHVTVASLEQFVLATGAAPELARVVQEKSTLRKLMKAAETILRDCAEEKREVEKQLDVAEELIFRISEQAQAGDFVTIGSLMPHTIAEIQALRDRSKDITGIPTGFVELDGLLNGFHPNDLIILAARPSIGKTAFVLNVLLNIALREKVPVSIFSLEMGREELNNRILCSHAKVPSHRVRRGMIKESEMRHLQQCGEELQQCPIFIDDTAGLSLMQLRARARRLKARQPDLGLVVIDYLQLMSGSERAARDQNRQQEVSEISRGLKALARELHVPVVALSQLSRNIEQRSGKEKTARPMLSDLRESGAIEQDADVVMFVHRERVEAQKGADGQVVDKSLPIPTEIIIGKHRNGPIGSANLLFFPDFTLFTDVAR